MVYSDTTFRSGPRPKLTSPPLPLLAWDNLLGGYLSRVIRLIGEISQDSFRSFTEEVSTMVEDNLEPIEIELFSDGGTSWSAYAFVAYMRMAHVKFHVTAYGNVESAAVLILAAGHVRRMTEEAWVMVHESSMTLKGNVTDLEREAEQLRLVETQWSKLMAKYTKATESYWGALHKETTYLSAEECLELGLIDEIV